LNRASLDYLGITLEEWQDAGLQQVMHPQDAEIVAKNLPGQLQSGSPFEYEVRLRRKDGQYRWFHFRFNPMSDEEGRVTRWYLAGTDIDDRKLAEQRLQEENVALREEIDKASMFEEIVGTSAPLKRCFPHLQGRADGLKRSDHRRDRYRQGTGGARHSPAVTAIFTLVCECELCVIPRDLIASELFGHEKGAFTGATQRRLGRFELAEKGTIFLDEVGELPAETQIALLRVLQEHEFERIGGTGSIRTDVRVIAATNRDLEAAIAAGTFRSDLFYRLNVFPIDMPPLRNEKKTFHCSSSTSWIVTEERRERAFGRWTRRVSTLLQSYSWPGNIRELQNVIERSVIVADGDTFSVDASWLSRRPHVLEPTSPLELPQQLAAQEKEMIEAALRECKGRVSGESGAAARLGMPGSTLESKIRVLKIDKKRFKA
jgi:PAS domain S-box-containing protein